MNMDKITETLRKHIYAEMERLSNSSNEEIPDKLFNWYLQLQILDKLEEIRICVIDVENEISKLNPEYK